MSDIVLTPKDRKALRPMRLDEMARYLLKKAKGDKDAATEMFWVLIREDDDQDFNDLSLDLQEQGISSLVEEASK